MDRQILLSSYLIKYENPCHLEMFYYCSPAVVLPTGCTLSVYSFCHFFLSADVWCWLRLCFLFWGIHWKAWHNSWIQIVEAEKQDRLFSRYCSVKWVDIGGVTIRALRSLTNATWCKHDVILSGEIGQRKRALNLRFGTRAKLHMWLQELDESTSWIIYASNNCLERKFTYIYTGVSCRFVLN